MMLFVGISLNRCSLFSVSDLTVPKFWFLREGNVVFFSDMIPSTFIFSSWVSFYVVVFTVFLSLSFSVWFCLRVSGVPQFCVSVTVLEFVHMFVDISIGWISRISTLRTNHSLVVSLPDQGTFNLLS